MCEVDTYIECKVCKENTFDYCVRACDNCQAYECNACGTHVPEYDQCHCQDEDQE